jgi:hypothetical protein
LQCISILNNTRRGGFDTRPYNNERDSRLHGNDREKRAGKTIVLSPKSRRTSNFASIVVNLKKWLKFCWLLVDFAIFFLFVKKTSFCLEIFLIDNQVFMIFRKKKFRKTLVNSKKNCIFANRPKRGAIFVADRFQFFEMMERSSKYPL